MVAVDTPAVQDLGDDLDVRGIEEPEIAGVAGQRDGRAAAPIPLEVAPVGHHTEAAVAQAECLGRGHAPAAVEGERPWLLAVHAVVGREKYPVPGQGDLLGARRAAARRDVLDPAGARVIVVLQSPSILAAL